MLLGRYGERMLLPSLVALIVYVAMAGWSLSWTTPLELFLRPPYHLWYIPVLFCLIAVARLLPFSVLLLAISTPFSLVIIYGFGFGPRADRRHRPARALPPGKIR